MKLITFTTITVIFIALILPAVLSFAVVNIPNNDQPSLDKTQKIYGDLIVFQAFTSKTENLATIGMSIKNPNLANKKDITLSIYDEGGILLRSVTINGKNIADGKFVKFKFEPIVGSQNKNFTFTLMSPTTSKEDADKNEALEVFLSDQTIEGASILRIGDREVSNSIVSFVSFSKPPYPTYVMENIYSKWFNKFSADWQFLIIYTVLVFTLAGFLLYKHAKSQLHR